MGRLIDLTGQVFERLTVLHREQREPGSKGHVKWVCVCKCGTQKPISGNDLRRGLVKSCGCLQREITQARNSILFSHPYGRSSRHNLLCRYKREAKNRDLVWALADEEFYALVADDCVYCGIPPQQCHRKDNKTNGPFWYNGIDRRDNAVGYVPDNCVSCCKVCNAWKRDMSETDFYEHVNRIASLTRGMAAAGGE